LIFIDCDVCKCLATLLEAFFNIFAGTHRQTWRHCFTPLCMHVQDTLLIKTSHRLEPNLLQCSNMGAAEQLHRSEGGWGGPPNSW